MWFIANERLRGAGVGRAGLNRVSENDSDRNPTFDRSLKTQNGQPVNIVTGPIDISFDFALTLGFYRHIRYALMALVSGTLYVRLGRSRRYSTS